MNDFGQPINGGGIATLEESIKYLPNMASLHPDTRVQVFREFKPRTNVVEITVYYREPDKKKYRVDAEVDLDNFEQGDELSPSDFKIIHWGLAGAAVNCGAWGE